MYHCGLGNPEPLWTADPKKIELEPQLVGMVVERKCPGKGLKQVATTIVKHGSQKGLT